MRSMSLLLKLQGAGAIPAYARLGQNDATGVHLLFLQAACKEQNTGNVPWTGNQVYLVIYLEIGTNAIGVNEVDSWESDYAN